MVSGETADGASLAVCLHQVFVKILKGGVRVLIIDCSAVSTLFASAVSGAGWYVALRADQG